MIRRLRYWVRHRRALAAAVSAHLDRGYRISAAAYRRMRDEARSYDTYP